MSLQERLEIIRSSPTPRGEERAKFQIIAPILQNLDWDPYGPEVLYEHPVGGKGGGGRVDIALRSSGRVVALIEAKAPGSDLRKHVTQVLGYAFHEGVDICALTTGLEWWLYVPRESGPPAERRFAVLNVTEDPVEQLLEDFNAFLSKEMLVSGQAESRAKAVRTASLEADRLNKEIPAIWSGMLTTPDEELIELVSKRVYERLNLRPTKQQVAAALRRTPIPPAAGPRRPRKPPTPPAPGQPPPTPERPQPGTKPVAMELWGRRHDVKSHADVLRTVIDALYDRHRHEFHRVLEVGSHQYPYAASDPEMLKPNGRSYNYEHAASGYFFDLWLNADGFKRRTRQFLAHFGHSPDDLKILYD